MSHGYDGTYPVSGLSGPVLLLAMSRLEAEVLGFEA